MIDIDRFLQEHSRDTIRDAVLALMHLVNQELLDLELRLKGEPTPWAKDEVSALSGEVGGLLERMHAIEAKLRPEQAKPSEAWFCYCGAKRIPGERCATCGSR